MIYEMKEETRFTIVDINNCKEIKGRIDTTTIDDDEPWIETEGDDFSIDWDIVLQYLWDFKDEKVVKMVEGLMLKINC